MKKLLLLIIIFWSVSIKAQTNVYHPFPTSNAIWREFSYHDQFQSSSSSCSDYQNEIYGDTIVGSFTYHKIMSYVKYYAFPYCGYPPSMYTPSYFNYYIGAFREDTAIRKVYFLPLDSISDTLLYDFNLNIGDTLPTTYTNNDHNDINSPVINIVTSIDSVLIGNEYHKRFEISALNWGGYFGPYVYLIEGIGSSFGLLGWLRPDPEVPIGSNLLCFKQNGLTVFPDSSYQCDIVSSIDENEIKSEPIIQIFPNPFSESTTIEFENKNSENYSLEIYNNLGQKVRMISNIRNNKIIIERGNFNSGIYFFQLKNNCGIKQTGKLVVE